jgi:hypothetical protein
MLPVERRTPESAKTRSRRASAPPTLDALTPEKMQETLNFMEAVLAQADEHELKVSPSPPLQAEKEDELAEKLARRRQLNNESAVDFSPASGVNKTWDVDADLGNSANVSTKRAIWQGLQERPSADECEPKDSEVQALQHVAAVLIQACARRRAAVWDSQAERAREEVRRREAADGAKAEKAAEGARAKEKAKKEAVEKAKREAGEKAKKEAEEKAKKEAEEKAKKEAEEKAIRETGKKAKKEAEEKAKKEAEEKAKKEAEEQAKKEAEEQAKKEAEEKAKKEAEEKAIRETGKKAKKEAATEGKGAAAEDTSKGGQQAQKNSRSNSKWQAAAAASLAGSKHKQLTSPRKQLTSPELSWADRVRHTITATQAFQQAGQQRQRRQQRQQQSPGGSRGQSIARGGGARR